MSRPEKLDNWNLEAAELMARNGLSLAQAVSELGIEITSDDVSNVLRRRSFTKLLWEARHRYFNELANNPNFKKDTIIGKLVSLAQRLEDQGDYDKAAEAILKAAKVAGFVGPESTVSVFGELSQSDLDQIRKKLEEGATSKGRIN
jgi:hypothetical protein